MIRLLACVGLILGLVLAMDRTLASGLEHLLLGSSDRFVAVYRPGPPVDVAILGNSRADNHFPADAVAEAACGRALNLGMGGAPTVVSAALWDDYLDRHGAPRLLILEPTSVVDDPRDLADAPMLSAWSERVDALVHEADATLWASNHAFRLLTFNSNQTIRTAIGLLHEDAADRTLTGHIGATHRAMVERAPPESWQPHARNLAALDHIVESARDHGTRVVVVITPLYRPFIAKLANYGPFFDALKARLPATVPVIDLREAVTDDALFADPLHVNRDGVRVILDRLRTELAGYGGCAGPVVAGVGTMTP